MAAAAVAAGTPGWGVAGGEVRGPAPGHDSGAHADSPAGCATEGATGGLTEGAAGCATEGATEGLTEGA